MPESESLRSRILAEIMKVRAVDVHSHVPAGAPFAQTLADILGYHYYTELAHSAGMPKAVIAPGRPEDEMVPELLAAMQAIDNTVQYSWLVELARELFGFEDPKITPENWEPLAEQVKGCAARGGRAREILDRSHIEKVFLTNNFDEDLSGVDTDMFVPCLRADNLVFGLADPAVRTGLEQATGVAVGDVKSLRSALGALVERFCSWGARSAAISLPPQFACASETGQDFGGALADTLRDPEGATDCAPAVQSGVMYELADLCRQHSLPFQIMFGVVRNAYAHGVPSGTDLPVAGASLAGLLPLLNDFPEVTFCLSILSDSQVQELNSFGWMLQNVVLSGHWWYLNVPEYIAYDLGARIQSVPKTKLIGYYSDMYKLEFGLPKFNMYRRVLAHVLAGHFVEAGLGSEEDAAQVARLLLRDNACRIFGL